MRLRPEEGRTGRTALHQCCSRLPRPPLHPWPAQELTEEERRDVYTRTLARMKQVHLDGLMELNSELAK